MNSKERLTRRLAGKPVDRAPNCNLIMAFAPLYIGKPQSQFYLDYKVLVESNLRVAKDFDLDILGAISDPFREVFDFGGKVEFPEDDIPLCSDNLLKSYEDLPKLQIFDPYRSTRMQDRIQGIELYKREAGSEYPIMGWVEAPFAEAVDLRGMNEIMLDVYDHPEKLHQLLEICLEAEIRSAVAQIKAGADLIGMGDAAASLLGPDLFGAFALPYEQRLIAAVHEAGALARLHICGNTTAILNLMKLSGADIIDVDWKVNFKLACETYRGYAAACGNFDPVAVVQQGTPARIREAVWKCLDAGDANTLIMAGCEIPLSTPHENLKAIAEALRDYPRY
ncbi:Uroporphyrinogen decarboxylase [Acididesulfobacillus acetoxydans]|uniref:Uroporphyrinogen decarboxylase n=1 Tax=Acididesulfobacillus acetoxydans TaxID=1561005 RepID=A0A8S0VXY6_9FIRM|nr:uroporphyrinogen decarboxylase family protein [Acididesulfobacillus acetoxydans]CAA7602433.1 Uroporphyrinogen decarboxylase [Acididesulfobacillus acetoxydans]CEJ08332.1 Uroporphyrinogen decarboxylase (URO-D) super [Acididesulfobacillus acetoxydans]